MGDTQGIGVYLSRCFLLQCLLVGMVTHASNSLANDDSSELGRQIVERECEACHGKDGVSDTTTTPSIGGFSETAILDLLATYQDNARPANAVVLEDGSERTMNDVVQQVSQSEREQSAKYYASLTWKPHEQSFDRKLAVKGKRIHRAKCGKCHIKEGSVPEADHALLLGQWRDYLVQQFSDFDSRERRMASKMQQKYDSLSAGDKVALIELYASGGQL